MSAVSLELLARKTDIIEVKPAPVPVPEPEPKIEIVVDERADINKRYNEGIKSYYGIEKPRNYNIAFAEFQFAAKRDHLESIVMIGHMYKKGYGVTKNESEAISSYERAASLGSTAAKYYLSLLMISKVILYIKLLLNKIIFFRYKWMSTVTQLCLRNLGV
jgi:TPR repeat protein